MLLFFFFFFQAEDGIRDRNVTGFRRVLFRSQTPPTHLPLPVTVPSLVQSVMVPRLRPQTPPTLLLPEIGRASCRERVEIEVEGGAEKDRARPCRVSQRVHE